MTTEDSETKAARKAVVLAENRVAHKQGRVDGAKALLLAAKKDLVEQGSIYKDAIYAGGRKHDEQECDRDDEPYDRWTGEGWRTIWDDEESGYGLEDDNGPEHYKTCVQCDTRDAMQHLRGEIQQRQHTLMLAVRALDLDLALLAEAQEHLRAIDERRREAMAAKMSRRGFRRTQVPG